jgi:hypothetical protein
MPLRCSSCDVVIVPGRIEAILEATGDLPSSCRECAEKTPNKGKKVGFMIYSHKTAGECIVLDANNKEHIRQARRVYRRSR